MINIVHKSKLRVCQWSGEIIPDGQASFAYPYFDEGKIAWRGCYVTPQCALAGLKQHADQEKLPPEKQNELCDIFQASLRVNGDSGHTTISAAPNPHVLVYFGGAKTIDEYRLSYDPQRLSHKVYVQVIPAGEPLCDIEDKSHKCKKWSIATVSPKDAELPPSDPASTPRNMGKVIRYLNYMGPAESDAAALYMKTGDMFAIGDFDANAVLPPINPLASALIGVPVYGRVAVFHKKKLKLKKKLPAKRRRVAAEKKK